MTYITNSSSVNKVTRLWAGEPGVWFLAGVTSISLSKTSRSAVLPQPLSPGVKWPGCEVVHSFPSSTKVTNECSYTPTHQICHHGINLPFVLQTDNPLCNVSNLCVRINIHYSYKHDTNSNSEWNPPYKSRSFRGPLLSTACSDIKTVINLVAQIEEHIFMVENY
jgi:hypothetical protein